MTSLFSPENQRKPISGAGRGIGLLMAQGLAQQRCVMPPANRALALLPRSCNGKALTHTPRRLTSPNPVRSTPQDKCISFVLQVTI
ncbi:hypothetical protein [Erwinia amylovora]|uniref:hypothetical protein n=1 Tax=Erwinia amylovora TaxID=552 RepID=UPI00194F0E98|nr:hypothetical protein [Erwinia amylovora]